MNQKSKFTFSKPILFKFNFETKVGENDTEQDIQNNFSVSSHKESESNKAAVLLEARIGDNNTPFKIDADIGATFAWDESFTEKQVEILLNQNAPSLLLSYLRSIVSNATSSSLYGSYDIPFMNFTNNEKKTSTDKKEPTE